MFPRVSELGFFCGWGVSLGLRAASGFEASGEAVLGPLGLRSWDLGHQLLRISVGVSTVLLSRGRCYDVMQGLGLRVEYSRSLL